MYYKYNDNGDVVNISSKSEYLSKIFESSGIVYREKTEPVMIYPAKRNMLVLASDSEMFYSTGDLVFKKVEKGELVVDGKFAITSEEVLEHYEPFKDSNGNVVDGMYTKINEVLVIKNPFNKPIVRVNTKGYVFEQGDCDSYIVTDRSTGELEYIILTEKKLNEGYTKTDSKVLSKNKSN